VLSLDALADKAACEWLFLAALNSGFRFMDEKPTT
jgi:hypothetical protein